MSKRLLPIVLLVGVLAAACLAIFETGSEAAATSTSSAPAQVAREPATELEPPSPEDVLPPNHPSVGGARPALLPASEDEPAITWKVPPAWPSAPNPNAMRLATFRVPASAKGHEPADLSVTRAGGTADANIERWLSQFKDASAETRTVMTVRGRKITIVEVSGTFTGGSMTPGSVDAPRAGWALLGAIVETPGSPYFFKLTGDAATVHAARAAFVALLDSITPS